MAIKCTTLTESHSLKSFRICYASLLCCDEIPRDRENANRARMYSRKQAQLCHGKPLAILRQIGEKGPFNTSYVYKLMMTGNSDNNLDELAIKILSLSLMLHARWAAIFVSTKLCQIHADFLMKKEFIFQFTFKVYTKNQCTI